MAEENSNHIIDMDTLQKQLLISERPIHVEVTKNSKGYNYSVSYHGKDPEECLQVVMDVMEVLKTKFEP